MLKFRDLSIRWKTAIPIIIFISFGVLLTIYVTGVKTRSIVLDEIRESSLERLRDTVLNSLTTMMLTGDYAKSETAFLGQMQKVSDIKVLRAESVNKDFATVESGSHQQPSDSLEREVLEKGVERIQIEGDFVRGVFPYIAKKDFMGKDCLSCHRVREGDVLGAVSIRIPIKESAARIRSLQYLYGLLGLFGIFAVVLIVLFVVRFTHMPLVNLAADLKDVSNRHEHLVLSYKGKDEVAQVALNVSKSIQYFNSMIHTMLVNTSKLLPIVDILKNMVEKTAAGAKKQSDQASGIATASQEMSHTITDIANNAAAVARTAAGALDEASRGSSVADNAVSTVNSVHLSTAELTKSVEGLNNRVGEIGDIVTVIKDIADQTNLLALNAAIEAARAGEQGRGFAVVADEVRKLAERTIRATSEISAKIEAVQAESGKTMTSMSEASEKVSRATGDIQNVGAALTAILSAVQEVLDQITRIAASVEEQSATSEEVSKNITITSEIARDIENQSATVNAEVNKLASFAEEMRASTKGIKTRGGAMVMFELAKNDHSGFVKKIGSCLRGELNLDPSSLPDHHDCRFGKWYYKEGIEICGNVSTYRAIEPPHDKIHSLAKDAVAAHNSGETDKAQRLYREMEAVSGQILQLLDENKEACS
ncbi:MAG: methyl-accepting chemotaxis protein [Nitrospiraceae bacterium]|nr:methyl-accepting chemotaxis protein [Nitrospiraceae bacterium]